METEGGGETRRVLIDFERDPAAGGKVSVLFMILKKCKPN